LPGRILQILQQDHFGSRCPARSDIEKAGEDVAKSGLAFTTRSGAGAGPGATLISPRATVACTMPEPTLTSYVTGRRRGGVPPLAVDAQGAHQRGVPGVRTTRC
jgi:hypothetical protein